jgi:hypothetical protein
VLPALIASHSLHGYLGHTLIEARLLAGYRLADEGGGHEGLPGVNVTPRVPLVHCSAQQPLERWFELVEEALRQAAVSRVTGVKSHGKAAFGADEFGKPTDPADERFPRIERGRPVSRVGDAVVDLVLRHSDDEVKPWREVAITKEARR